MYVLIEVWSNVPTNPNWNEFSVGEVLKFKGNFPTNPDWNEFSVDEVSDWLLCEISCRTKYIRVFFRREIPVEKNSELKM